MWPLGIKTVGKGEDSANAGVGRFFVPGNQTLDFWAVGPVGLGPAIKGTCFFFLLFLTMSKVINGPLAEQINFLFPNQEEEQGLREHWWHGFSTENLEPTLGWTHSFPDLKKKIISCISEYSVSSGNESVSAKERSTENKQENERGG